MFKKIKLLMVLFLFPMLVMSCNKTFVENIKAPLRITKPSANFYTNHLIRSIKNSNDLHISIFYNKTGKNKTFSDKNVEKFKEFIEHIKPVNFLDENKNLINLKEPEYRITICINQKNSFIINVFNNSYLTIHPWDGVYSPDVLDISNFHEGINLYNLCDFIIKKDY